MFSAREFSLRILNHFQRFKRKTIRAASLYACVCVNIFVWMLTTSHICWLHFTLSIKINSFFCRRLHITSLFIIVDVRLPFVYIHSFIHVDCEPLLCFLTFLNIFINLNHAMRVKVNVIEFHTLPPLPRVFCEDQKKINYSLFELNILILVSIFRFFFVFR